MRDLVCGHSEGREDAQPHTAKEGRCNQHAIEGIVETVSHEHQHSRGVIAGVIV